MGCELMRNGFVDAPTISSLMSHCSVRLLAFVSQIGLIIRYIRRLWSFGS